MSPSRDEFSDTDSDDGFNEDIEALKRACQFAGENPTDHQLSIFGNAVTATGSSEAESDGEGDEDLQLVRSIQERFAVVPMDMEDEPLMMKPLCTLPPDWSDSDDCEDDYATLRAIQRRFAAYNDGVLEDNSREFSHGPVQVGSNIIDSEKETSNSFVERTNAREGFLNCVDTSEPIGKEAEACDDAGGTKPSDLAELNGPGTDDVTGLPLKSSQFPKSALAFVDAIKQNRSFQKVIRSKMTQMEARMEELKKLTERVKILKDFQVACKKRTGRALSQKKDARVQLISLPKLRANTKLNDTKIPAASKGPPENTHVAYYKEAMTTFAVNVSREKWSKEEKENLVKGVKQQFQEMLLQRSVDLLSDADGSYDPGNVDSILTSIKDIDITPDKIRLFLPKVNWEQLAAMYVPGRSGAECQARFLNVDDPLINHKPWTAMEDKNILHIVQQKGLNNWIDIAASLGTNRTPFQCLARYQRSLNASILKREWTKEEDNQLRTAVETYGESNWQVVASVMEGRTGTQCSNRWLKTLHPARKRVGKWTEEEDKRLKVATTLFGPKTWRKIANYVPGRTHVQCRERWVNCLDPSLNTAEWTEEEDSKLEMAIEEYGYCWSKVAACIPCRTDNQCWRRWKALFPNEVPMLQEAKKIRRAALISNFVDRESERPALGPSDFRLPETQRITGSENVDLSSRKTRRSRQRQAREPVNGDTLSSEICSEEAPRSSDGNEVEKSQGGSIPRKRRAKSSRSINNNAGPSSSRSSPCRDAALLDMSNDAEIRKSGVNNDLSGSA
ncbi:myb-like protein l [Phtheirospermum japonicum]|uniref:Myb-like protein l n=1 Tax=Phtheirospermum japonicum TaxID=374723 RepID=A0A830BR14_9LAMI|nr:myb-like protein l [Phtheirospermum japonicum]